MKDKRLFISQNPGGIGNRVRNMVSGMMDANSWASFSSLDNWRVFWVDGWHSCGEKNKKNKFTVVGLRGVAGYVCNILKH